MNPQAPASTLTVRDMIAIEAMKSFISISDMNRGFEIKKYAYASYEVADALIAYSQKK